MIAVILAGGSGRRYGAALPKQLTEINGRKVLEITLDAFQTTPGITDIIIVAHPDHIAEIREIAEHNGGLVACCVVAGGNERSDSSIAALEALKSADGAEIVMFHDAVRPLVDSAIISRCAEGMSEHRAVAAGVPTTDTIWATDESGRIVAVPDRARLCNAQTPQCFRLADIREAYARALADPAFRATDECGVVLRYLPECHINVVEGASYNIKLTFPHDIHLVETILASRVPTP